MRLSAGTLRRQTILVMVVVMCVICYGDRAALSVGMSRISEDFALTPRATGWVLSSFLWSYFLLNLPSALLLDRYGPRLIGAASVALWSVAMILGSACPGIVPFVLTRILLGAGEAPTFSLGNKVVHGWASPRARGAMMTAFVGGIPIGLAAGAFIGSALTDRFGWRVAFAALGALGLVWSAAWLALYPAARSDQSRAVPFENACSPVALPPLHRLRFSVRQAFRSRAFWGVVVSQCCGNYANFLLMSWLPLMLRQILHLGLLQSGAYTAYAYLFAAALSFLAGKTGDRLMQGRTLSAAPRRYFTFLCYVLAASMGLLPWCHSAVAIVGLLAFSLAFVMSGTASNMALLSDVLVESDMLGATTGLVLTFSNGVGIAAPILTGYLLAWTGNFHAVFFITAGLLAIGAIAALLLPTRQISVTRHPARRQP